MTCWITSNWTLITMRRLPPSFPRYQTGCTLHRVPEIIILSLLQSNTAKLVQETWYEVVIRYGLYLGAVFQMACILAVILLPEKETPEGDLDGSGCSDDEASRAGSPSHCNQSKKSKKKHEKKKKQL